MVWGTTLRALMETFLELLFSSFLNIFFVSLFLISDLISIYQ